jgi:hypothetical protein
MGGQFSLKSMPLKSVSLFTLFLLNYPEGLTDVLMDISLIQGAACELTGGLTSFLAPTQ